MIASRGRFQRLLSIQAKDVAWLGVEKADFNDACRTDKNFAIF
jgi:hypothetical protein